MAIGVVANAAPVGVFPAALSALFTRSAVYPVQSNYYGRGETQISTLAATSRKTFDINIPVTAAQLDEFRDFWEDHEGPRIPFVFYDGRETTPKWTTDPTGAAVDGRYVVRFDGAWEQTFSRPGRLRTVLSFRLCEVA